MRIHDIGDTALLTAYARAIESDRSDALFKDPFARVMAGERGAALAESSAVQTLARSIGARTAVFDELLLRVIGKEGIQLVLNLGAGLDARPFRLDLPKALLWVDVDREGMLQYKLDCLHDAEAKCGYLQHAANLTDPRELIGVLEHITAGSRTLVLTEGLLVYLSEREVELLAAEMYSRASIEWWITDVAGPRALALMANAWGALLAGAQLQFAPADSVQFFYRNGWCEWEYRSSQEEAQRLGRAPVPAGLASLVARFAPRKVKEELRRLSGVAVLKRIKDRSKTLSSRHSV